MTMSINHTNRIRAEVVTVTPEQAGKWLERSTNVRPVSDGRVETLCRVLLAGGWKLNGEPIIFDEYGNLVDGQHRLWAIFKSGVTAILTVVTGVPRDAVPTIDTGTSRPTHLVVGSQFSETIGDRNAGRFTAVVAAIDELQHKTKIKTDAGYLVGLYANHRDGVDWVLEAFPTRYVCPASVAGALAWAYPTMPDAAEKFGAAFAVVASPHRNDSVVIQCGPATALYSAIVRMRQNRDGRIGIMYKALRCLMAFAKGERFTRVEQTDLGFKFFHSKRVAMGLTEDR